MKTIVFCTSPHDNSISRHSFYLIEQLAKRNKVIVVFDQNPEPHEYPQVEGVQYECWPSGGAKTFADFRFILRILLKNRPELLYTQFSATSFSVYAALLARVPQRVVYWHTMLGQMHFTTKTKIKLKLKKLLLNNSVSHVFTNSTGTRQELINALIRKPEKVSVLPYLVQPIKERADLLTFEKRKRQICFVGRICEEKGQMIVLQALEKVLKSQSDLTLLFIGRGPQQEELKKLVQEFQLTEQVKLLGLLEIDDVREIMAQSLVHISASKEEAFGLVNLEALSVGTPILATNVGGIVDMLQEGKNGFFIDPRNGEELAQKLAQLLGESRWTNLSEGAFNSFQSKYATSAENLDQQAKQIESYLD